MTQLYNPHDDWAREDAEMGSAISARWQVERVLRAIADGSLVSPDQTTWETTTAQVQLGGRDIAAAELRAIWELIEGKFATWTDSITLTPSGEQWLARLTALAPYATASGTRSHKEPQHLAEVRGTS